MQGRNSIFNKIRESDILTLLLIMSIFLTVIGLILFSRELSGKEITTTEKTTIATETTILADTEVKNARVINSMPPSVTVEPLEQEPEVINGRIQPNDLEPFWTQCGLTEKEFEYFAQVVQAEQNVSYEGQLWVAEVIWNRTKDVGGYEGTVTEVLNASGQFSTTSNGKCKTKATDNSKKAVVEAYLNVIIPENVIYFRAGYYFSGHKKYAECGNNYFSIG